MLMMVMHAWLVHPAFIRGRHLEWQASQSNTTVDEPLATANLGRQPSLQCLKVPHQLHSSNMPVIWLALALTGLFQAIHSGWSNYAPWLSEIQHCIW